MKRKSQEKYRKRRVGRYQILSGLLAVCLILQSLNLHFIPTYAADRNPVSFLLGGEVTGILKEGVLTLSGQGNTDDYSKETAPFLEYADEIQSLVIEDGVTYIGAYLFYGLHKLGGELVLPKSITGFGDYAFSGESIENAPKFTVIRNQFASAEICEEVKPESLPPEDSEPQDNISNPSEDDAADVTEPPASADEDLPDNQPAEEAAPQDDNAEEPAVEQEVPQENNAVESGQQENTVRTQTITQQQITHPGTLFMAGQSGLALCTPENSSFAESAQRAGYQVSDTSVKINLDDEAVLELPVENGSVCLPECPEELKTAHAEDSFFSYEFAGWSQTQSDNAENAAAPGQYMSTGGAEQLSLYSVWNTVSKFQIRTKAVLKDGTATYTLVNGEAEEELMAPEGYAFYYQWQVSDKNSDEEEGWTDLDGAEEPVYQRAVESADANKQFRCKVTAVKQARTREIAEPVTLYSQATDAAVEQHTVYVSQESGKDSNNGITEDSPFQTLQKAAEFLNNTYPNGTVETNKIVLLENYSLQQSGSKILGEVNVNVTICGKDKNITLRGAGSDAGEKSIDLSGNLKLETLKLVSNVHIYGNGYDITFGTDITSGVTYLYGSKQGPAENKIDKVGKIKVESGDITRIVGYARSNTGIHDGTGILDVDNLEASITVSGNAIVDTIVAGSASGGTMNGNVKIAVESGKVTTITGGNQGFSTAKSPFTGKTTIKVSGGSVTSIYGAGTGRNQSIPTYLGNVDIDVTGGDVTDIYGAGSAAFIKSEEGITSTVKISAQGGTIGNIYAAGKGNENNVDLSTTQPEQFGSLQGNADITIGGNAVITGNVYASGSGADNLKFDATDNNGLKENAYLDGNVAINMNSGTVKGSIYGGGKGFNKDGYRECARVKAGSTIKVIVSGGTVEGSVFGGGENGKVEGNTDVTVSGGIIKGNVYGGSKNAVVEGRTNVTITNGTIESSVYGGSLGSPKTNLVLGGATVNMTGGWVKNNVYGGSEQSDDGKNVEGAKEDLIFVNVTGGTVTRNVFGGGYLGTVYGSTHVHIGVDSLGKCTYYSAHTEDQPNLTASRLTIEGSAYAGGDFGGGTNYDEITITGTSHVYIDGTGYNTGSSADTAPEMKISGGVFGSGASCDAGSTRLVTLDHYGVLDNQSGSTNATRTLDAIQRADRVLLIQSHVRLTGKSDIANSNATALYSLNRIGDHENPDVGKLGKGLVLQGGSTVILDSEANGLGRFSSIDGSGNAVELKDVGTTDAKTANRVCFDAGTVFRVAIENDDKTLAYGEVSGYSYMEAGDTAEVFAYARIKTETENSKDGGFKDPNEVEESKEIHYKNVESDYRYWQMKKAETAIAERSTVLTVQELESGQEGYVDGTYAVAEGTIELPHASLPTKYTIKQISSSGDGGLKLVEAARDGMKADSQWATSKDNQATGEEIELSQQQEMIEKNPLSNFGLFMETGDGFGPDTKGKVISQRSMVAGNSNTIIGSQTVQTASNTMPKIKFYLTYSNKGITVSKNLGAVDIQLEGVNEAKEKTTINIKVEIISKATALSDQSIDLYATESGSYTGKLTIPAGVNRSLTLDSVSSSTDNFVSYDSPTITEQQFGISMQAVQSSGWSSVDVEPHDLKSFTAGTIGTTDIRYEAVVEFHLKNAPGFEPKETPDTVELILKDGDNQSTKITLNIHWRASVVSDVQLTAGRQYDNLAAGQGNPVISPKSSVTSRFVLGGVSSINNLWLELKNIDNKEMAALPAGTVLTLLTDNEFYTYTVTGSEEKNRIPLSTFKKMWGDGVLTGSTVKDAVWSVITDFSGAAATLSPANYGLRLREETSADSQDDYFTVNNSAPTVNITADPNAGLSRGEYSFTIQALSNNDTRFADGGTALLVPDGKTVYPPGTVVSYSEGGREFTVYPRGGKIYLPLPELGSRTFTMSTVETAGLTIGENAFKAVIMPSGSSSGAKWECLESSTATFSVRQNPESALSVALEGGTRVVKAGDILNFKAEYVLSPADTKVIGVSAQKKESDRTYSDVDSWNAEGTTIGTDTSPQVIKVTVPSTIASGTYRLVFSLGDRKVPYNLIVE